jgi:hypothetical protein
LALSLKQQLAELTRRHSIKLEPTEVTEERDQVLLGKDHFCLQVWDMLFEIISLLSEDRCAPMKKIEINRITLTYKKGDLGYLCTGEKEG